MFNSTHNSRNSTSITFDAPPASGIIQKSHEKSFFLRMHQNSELSKQVFEDCGNYKNKQIIVLQVLLTHDGWFLVELIFKKDNEG